MCQHIVSLQWPKLKLQSMFVQIGGKTVSLTSASDISLQSEEGAVELSGGVVLDTVMLPHGGGGYSVSNPNSVFSSKTFLQGEVGQFQLCICMPSGLLFKVAIPTDNPTRPPQYQVDLLEFLSIRYIFQNRSNLDERTVFLRSGATLSTL